MFYAGHGIEMDGVNCVVPVDARLERDVDVRFETVTLDDVGLLFRWVRAHVLMATNGAQRPHEYHSLLGEHYFTRTLAATAPVTVERRGASRRGHNRPSTTRSPGDRRHGAANRRSARASRGQKRRGADRSRRDVQHGRGMRKDYVVACPGSGKRPNNATPPGRLPWVHVREEVSGWCTTPPKRFSGNPVRPHRATRAQNNIDVSCRVAGRGVMQDYRETVSWFRRAAEQGPAGWQNNLGMSIGLPR